MPDDLYRHARRAGLNISQLAQQSVGRELERLGRIAALDRYLVELEAQHGPMSDEERTEAADWADRVLGQESERSSA